MSQPTDVPAGLLISRDLFFTSKVTGTARELGCAIEVVPDCSAAASRIAASPVRCVFVDLAVPVTGLVEFIRGLPSADKPTVVAFGSHVATARLQEARDAGCDEVLPRSRFSGELPALLRKYLWMLLALIAFLPGRAIAQFGVVGGVYVDAEGMLRESATLSPDERLKLFPNASVAPVAGPMAASSRLRKVSLRRLETAVGELHAAGNRASAEMQHLAGLQEVRYVFVRPDEQDVILAGRAEGWKELPGGDVVGKKSGRPVLDLDDLLVALRFAFDEQRRDGFLGCSIDPTAAGAKEHADFVGRLDKLDRSQSATILRGMERAMGPQTIRVYGAPESSRFALQLIAADYRLKRLALDHDPSPSKKVPSFLDIAARNVTAGPQPQHRWWFVGHYDAIRFTPDRLAFEFEGTGLRVDTGPSAGSFAPVVEPAKPSRAATLFAEAATRGFTELAGKIPAFAELQNLVALAVAAELIYQKATGLTGEEADVQQTGASTPKSESWRPKHFLDTRSCPIAEFETPKQTPSLANVRIVKDRHWLFSISGGVEVNPAGLANSRNWKPAVGGQLDAARRVDKSPNEPGRWWWD